MRRTRCTGRPRKPVGFAAAADSIERLHEEFKRRIKAQTVPPSAETAAVL